MMIHKITPSLDNNRVVETLENSISLNNQSNKEKIPNVVKPTNKKTL